MAREVKRDEISITRTITDVEKIKLFQEAVKLKRVTIHSSAIEKEFYILNAEYGFYYTGRKFMFAPYNLFTEYDYYYDREIEYVKLGEVKELTSEMLLSDFDINLEDIEEWEFLVLKKQNEYNEKSLSEVEYEITEQNIMFDVWHRWSGERIIFTLSPKSGDTELLIGDTEVSALSGRFSNLVSEIAELTSKDEKLELLNSLKETIEKEIEYLE